jgi:hypothetical protein
MWANPFGSTSVTITDINQTGAKAPTVGVVSATSFHGGRASTDLGDNGCATAVTISDTKQTRARR